MRSPFSGKSTKRGTSFIYFIFSHIDVCHLFCLFPSSPSPDHILPFFISRIFFSLFQRDDEFFISFFGIFLYRRTRVLNLFHVLHFYIQMMCRYNTIICSFIYASLNNDVEGRRKKCR